MNEVLDTVLTNLEATKRIPQFVVDGCLLEDTKDGIYFMYDVIRGYCVIDKISCSYVIGSPYVRVLIDLK